VDCCDELLVVLLRPPFLVKGSQSGVQGLAHWLAQEGDTGLALFAVRRRIQSLTVSVTVSWIGSTVVSAAALASASLSAARMCSMTLSCNTNTSCWPTYRGSSGGQAINWAISKRLSVI
jgi:hypothetical protein